MGSVGSACTPAPAHRQAAPQPLCNARTASQGHRPLRHACMHAPLRRRTGRRRCGRRGGGGGGRGLGACGGAPLGPAAAASERGLRGRIEFIHTDIH